MHDIVKIINAFENDCVFTEDSVIEILQQRQKEIKKSTVRWDLYHLVQKGEISKIGIKTYKKSYTKKYEYDYLSNEARIIAKTVKESFGNIKIAIWDEKILNEWLNLLLTQNIVFVEVEKEYMDFVFDKIKEKFEGNVLLNPTIQDIYKYQKDNIIVIKPLTTKAQINTKDNKTIIEKLIVDLLYDKILSKLIDTDESYNIINVIQKNYAVDYSKLLTYAERKHKKNEIIKILKLNDKVIK